MGKLWSFGRSCKDCWSFQELSRGTMALWKKRLETCVVLIQNLSTVGTLHSLMYFIFARRVLSASWRTKSLSDSHPKSWLPGTFSLAPTTTSTSLACDSPSYGVWEYSFAIVFSFHSGEHPVIEKLLYFNIFSIRFYIVH